MKIAGVQKLTLLDFPGHIAATLFTPGCNLRCPFCHNSELVQDLSDEEYYPDEVIEFLKTRVGKLDGIAVTGGEPLMQQGIEEFFRNVKAIGMKIKLDTNGTYPDKLKAIIDEGLVDYVAMDIKNCPANWKRTAGLDHAIIAGETDQVVSKRAEAFFANTKRSMDILKNSGIPFEFRTTVVKELHSKEDMLPLAEFIGPVDNYFLQKFKDSGAILEDGFTSHEDEELKEFLKIVQTVIPNAKLRGVD